MNMLMNAGAMLMSTEAQVEEFNSKIKDLVSQATIWIYSILGILVVLWGIYIGIKWATARRAEQHQEAKDLLKRFFVGLILMFVVGAVAGIILGVMQAKFA